MLFSSWFITGCGTDRLDNSTKAEGENTANTISGSLVSGNGTANSNTTSAPYNRKSRIADVMAALYLAVMVGCSFPCSVAIGVAKLSKSCASPIIII